MKKTIRIIIILCAATAMIIGAIPAGCVSAAEDLIQMSVAASEMFSDVPSDSWARSTIESCVNNGLMSGMGDGLFGYGRSMTRAEFVTVLSKMFGWKEVIPEKPSFSDVSPDQWFYRFVEAAAMSGVVTVDPMRMAQAASSDIPDDHTILENTVSVDAAAAVNAAISAAAGAEIPMNAADTTTFAEEVMFYPDTPITRKDMAVMLVKALGYNVLAQQAEKTELTPFDDVDSDAGYIVVAHDIGMINGVGDGKFAPDDTAKREEAATMLMRVYNRLSSQTEWLHGFYAFSSYGQRDFIDDMDAITFGWSAMEWSAEDGAKLNVSSRGGNQWRIPDSYESIAEYPREKGITANLNVYMDVSMGLYGLLADYKSGDDAIEAILDETKRVYEAIGRNPYNGVTIDFEGLKGDTARYQYTAFLSKLSRRLKEQNLMLYVAVHPVSIDEQYFDGYNYRKIGQFADKVILMAHDYQPSSLEGLVGSEWQKNAALTPITEIYKALKAITDPETGVEDTGKIALAISFACVGWKIDENGNVQSPSALTPTIETVNTRMNQSDAVHGWSEAYRNPYLIYTTENGERIFLWYEDSRSVSEKLKLARLFTVTGVSVWRLGSIPNYDGWNAWTVLAP